MARLEKRYEDAAELAVHPLKMEELADDFNKQHPRSDGWIYDFTRPLAAVSANDKLAVTDHECVFYTQDADDGGFRIPLWGMKHNKDGGKSASVFPIGDAVYDWNELASYHMGGVMTLKQFMAGRYKYNSRIESNTAGFLNFLNRVKKIEHPKKKGKKR